MTSRSKPASRIVGQDLLRQVPFAEVEGRVGLHPLAVTLVERLRDAGPLPLEDGVVRRDEVVGPLVLPARAFCQAAREEGHDAAGEPDRLAHQEVDRLAVVLDQVVVVLDLPVAAEQHGHAFTLDVRVSMVVARNRHGGTSRDGSGELMLPQSSGRCRRHACGHQTAQAPRRWPSARSRALRARSQPRAHRTRGRWRPSTRVPRGPRTLTGPSRPHRSPAR